MAIAVGSHGIVTLIDQNKYVSFLMEKRLLPGDNRVSFKHFIVLFIVTPQPLYSRY